MNDILLRRMTSVLRNDNIPFYTVLWPQSNCSTGVLYATRTSEHSFNALTWYDAYTRKPFMVQMNATCKGKVSFHHHHKIPNQTIDSSSHQSMHAETHQYHFLDAVDIEWVGIKIWLLRTHQWAQVLGNRITSHMGSICHFLIPIFHS